MEEVLVEREEVVGSLLPFEAYSPRQIVNCLRDAVPLAVGHDAPANLQQQNLHRYILECENIDRVVNLPQLRQILEQFTPAWVSI